MNDHLIGSPSTSRDFAAAAIRSRAIRNTIAWARARSISRFLVSISPTNGPSLALAAKLHLIEVTRVVDDKDGPEVVFELRT